MDLMKYVVVAGISLIIAIIASVMGNVLSGILIFVLLLGGYILWNITKVMKSNTGGVILPQVDNTKKTTGLNPPKDN